MKYFLVPTLVSSLLLAGIFIWLGPWAFVTAFLLVILEVTLSFDNAVVNARVLMRMSEAWQRRFLTWGILIAVFGTRLVLPILIVSAGVWMSPWAVAQLAALDPEAYAHLLEGAKHAIYSFGAAFLVMVSLKYFFDESKEVHWIAIIERQLSGWGRIEAIEIGIALSTLVAFSFLVPAEQGIVLAAGVIGIILFIAMQGLASSFSKGVAAVGAAGLSLFLYLNVLDSAFSLDSVVGAFALSTSIPIIVTGLGIGAWYVRSMTIYFVRRNTLDTLVYLEHGAHWAIFGLAVSMFAGLLLEVPEIITGGIGLAFVTAAYYSSMRLRKREQGI
ncbi:MAG TPA: DUF475 domain-containing protein [Candidatus Paceibacterota bacterium]|nr:DUF475 domain-containing protein [Candidatus Paceibacterota bacterium]